MIGLLYWPSVQRQPRFRGTDDEFDVLISNESQPLSRYAMSSRIFTIIIVLLLQLTCVADTEKTNSTLVISGGRSVLKLNSTDITWIGGRKVFYSSGSLSLFPRTDSAPHNIVISVRGIPEMDLFLEGDSPSLSKTCSSEPRQILKTPLIARIGYRYCFQVIGFEKAQGQIALSADSAEPELIPMVIERPETFFESKFGTTFMSVLLVALGALVGLSSFYIQQLISIRNQQKAAFWDKKFAREDDLLRFFQDTYITFLNSKEPDTQRKARNIRRVLSKEGIYGMLPPFEMRNLNAICDGQFWPYRRLPRLKRLLRRNFYEMMRSD